MRESLQTRCVDSLLGPGLCRHPSDFFDFDCSRLGGSHDSDKDQGMRTVRKS